MIRVVIADDEALVRGGFRMILEAQAGIRVVGEARDGREALQQAGELKPDVILMDIRMPEMDGLEATRRIVEEVPQCRVLILTTFDLDEYVYQAMLAGASGFLLKDVPPSQLVDGVRAVVQGDALLAPSITKRLVEHYVRRPPPSVRSPAQLSGLTEREVEVLKLMGRGFSNAEIAQQLFLSQATVKTHVTRIFAKLALRDRAQAVVFAYEKGLVQFTESDPA